MPSDERLPKRASNLSDIQFVIAICEGHARHVILSPSIILKKKRTLKIFSNLHFQKKIENAQHYLQ
jgi:hypothetical protein